MKRKDAAARMSGQRPRRSERTSKSEAERASIVCTSVTAAKKARRQERALKENEDEERKLTEEALSRPCILCAKEDQCR